MTSAAAASTMSGMTCLVSRRLINQSTVEAAALKTSVIRSSQVSLKEGNRAPLYKMTTGQMTSDTVVMLWSG